MANSFFLSMAPDVAAVQAVVDAIRAVDFPATDAIITDVGIVTAGIRAVDVPAIQANIDAIPVLTEKEKMFMGKYGQPALNEYFQNVANGVVPNPDIWTLTLDGVAGVIVQYGDPGFLNVYSGLGATDDAVASTIGKYLFDPTKLSTTTLNLKIDVKFNGVIGEFGFGLIDAGDVGTADRFDQDINLMGIHCDNSVIRACNTNNGGGEFTDISAFITSGVPCEILIVYEIGVNIKFYVDGTLRATHTTRLPTHEMQCNIATKATNGQNSVLHCYDVEVWPT
ncbi:hypothetical protein LCGC14_1945630 [marine sediment metagenome]|uniref:Uncharacterized protein n=1 Tax=marine sediment metagenome TaxID=412755 RepID=A0A0F9G7B5_9ZZZZ